MEKTKKLKAPKKFTVLRRWWADAEAQNSEPETRALLRNPNGKKCCLGFYCEAAGVPKRATRDVDLPYNMEGYRVLGGFKLFDTASEINDDSQLTRPEREEQLRRLFARRGIEIVFK